ncbi:Histone-lysine N-methyltransferase ASHH1 [Capsicum annuum]|uniref:Histone-lysine N-methyltransferase ASHH1 n=1 Tax=Capsicum annuum TaxID=4072 RepID=A0A2G2Z215_CAPAN|nr:Histone-lysine N-methyltransferase ASHH1 [Capsicum annuum]KAF3648145.1 Histone-lysine N-methyltransferase ASHH1 [Capsicum annuum]PHT76029.1 Histone-lysine N-methyltransferase ASHH1 [Capsicum annuum]
MSYRRKKLKEDDIAICECKYDASDPESACGERCLNSLTNIECTPGYCKCGETCRNQIFQKCEYAKTKLFRTEGCGWGLLAGENIKAGQFIIEYCGEVILSEEAKKRSHIYEAHDLKDTYIISLNSNYFIDATRKGNLARFINHSCRPNCETRKWTVLGESRVGIFAEQDISVGMELTINYYFEWYGGATVRCLCGAANCSKFLGAKSKGFQVPEKTSEKERFVIVEAWKQSDFLCRNILSALQDYLYNMYSGTKTSKELWGALEQKYKTEDARTKKFFVARFLEYK